MNKKMYICFLGVIAVLIFVGCGDKGTGPSTDLGGDGYNSSYGTLTDERDSQKYKTVKIGSQTWMAGNLNYRNSTGSNDTVGVCYMYSADSCAKYGRLYNWETAMEGALSSSLRPSGVQGVCPVDWHLPSIAEWEQLDTLGGGLVNGGKKLKSRSGWYGNGNGTDDFGFSALPGGFSENGNFRDAGYRGRWWSTDAPDENEYGSSNAFSQSMDYADDYVGFYGDLRSSQLSVRCVQD